MAGLIRLVQQRHDTCSVLYNALRLLAVWVIPKGFQRKNESIQSWLVLRPNREALSLLVDIAFDV